mgnify:CR=1 FL=1
MRITVKQLKQLIRESVEEVMDEMAAHHEEELHEQEGGEDIEGLDLSNLPAQSTRAPAPAQTGMSAAARSRAAAAAGLGARRGTQPLSGQASVNPYLQRRPAK